MPKKSVKSLLADVICCVEAKNADGSDASKETENVLRSMGAQVESGGIRMGLTHMIWSNGNTKVVKAAEFMDIVVVSPLWVEQCREASRLVPVDDFIVSPEDAMRFPPPPLRGSAKALPVPVSHAADDFEDPSSFSSSQRMTAKDVTIKNKVDKSKKAGVIGSKLSGASKVVKTAPSAKEIVSMSKKAIENDADASVGCAPSRSRADESSSSASKSKRQRVSLEVAGSGSNISASTSSTSEKPSATSASLAASAASVVDAKAAPDVSKSRRLSSKLIVESKNESNFDVASSVVTNSKGKQKGAVPKAKRGVVSGKASLRADDSSSSSASECSSAGRGLTSKKTSTVTVENKLAKRKFVGESDAAGKKKAAPAPRDDGAVEKKDEAVSKAKGPSKLGDASSRSGNATRSAVLSVSGFNSDERGLLEDIMVSLISQPVQGKAQGMSQSPSQGGRRVLLQQSDPQMELQLTKAFMSCTHVITPEEEANSNRTLRILFAMARGIPVLTPAWVYASLDRGQWLWAPADYRAFMHPRFNPSHCALHDAARVSVYVGKCGDPSRRLVEALVDCFAPARRTSVVTEAALVVMHNPGEAESSLFSKSSKKLNQHVTRLEKEGRIISCKEFFDHIQRNSLLPFTPLVDVVPIPASSSPSSALLSGARKNMSSSNKFASTKGKVAPQAAPLVAAVDDEEDDDLALVPPSRGGRSNKTAGGKRTHSEMSSPSKPAARRSSAATAATTSASSEKTSAKTLAKSFSSAAKKGKADEMSESLSADVDYTDCLVTTPAGADVTLVDSDSDEASLSGSEMSFQLGAEAEAPRRGSKTVGKQWLAVDDEDEDEEDEEATGKSSYQSGEGSPCW